MALWGNFLAETLYTAVMTFFCVYVAMTVLQFRPFALGFHPPVQTGPLSIMAALIVLFVITVKILYLMMPTRKITPKKIYYVPAERQSHS